MISQTVLHGYLDEDLSLEKTPSAKMVCNFNLNIGERQGRPVYVRCSVFNALAKDLVDSAGKDDALLVRGHLKTDNRGQLCVAVVDIGISLADGPVFKE